MGLVGWHLPPVNLAVCDRWGVGAVERGSGLQRAAGEPTWWGVSTPGVFSPAWKCRMMSNPANWK
jgi:hypothetical protein